MNKLAVTDRGKVWEITNSIFVVFTFFLGFANWIAFLYCSWLVKCKKWRYYALLYASPLILTIIIGKFTDFTFYGVIISGIISIVHIFKIREEVLVRYDRLIKYSYLAEADIDELINKTRIDSENTPTEKKSFYVENKNTTLTQESESIISNGDIPENKENNIKDDETKDKGRIIDF
ncbi:hypothetical protein [Clostridium aciditolerans]|uniref:hypothetical protein n=1 Tax=Clostridium aciditolerans TaxID=339861 RepID=UPI001B3C96E8|nr:hypothetical protein [Clostridium aciditolerans]